METRTKESASPTDLKAGFDAAQRGPVIVDLSTSGRLEIAGADRLDLLHRLTSNDVAGARPGQVRSTLFLTDKGRLVDRALILVREDSLLLVTSPGADELIERWIDRYTITEDVSVNNITASTVMFSILGAAPESSVSTALGAPLRENTWRAWKEGGEGAVLALRAESRRRYALAIAPREMRSPAHDALTATGCQPIGSIAYEAYRINQGIPAKPGELSEAHNPYETGVIEDVSFTKGCYIGQEVIARIDTYQKSRRRLAGLLFDETAPGETGQPLLKGDREIGLLTSALNVRVADRYVGLGIVTDAEAPQGEILVTGESRARARVCDFPILASP